MIQFVLYIRRTGGNFLCFCFPSQPYTLFLIPYTRFNSINRFVKKKKYFLRKKQLFHHRRNDEMLHIKMGKIHNMNI